MPIKLLMIDNYDSFVYNLVQYFSELGCDVEVFRNDAITISEIRTISPDCIVISPGPSNPDEAGVSLNIIKELGDEFAVLGVCLGHQCIVQAFGGEIVHADHVMHGKVSEIEHDQQGLYEGLSSPLSVTRYHSLVASKEHFPESLKVTARFVDQNSGDETIMSCQHKTKKIFGVQYHPESILTHCGKEILKNFLRLIKKNV